MDDDENKRAQINRYEEYGYSTTHSVHDCPVESSCRCQISSDCWILMGQSTIWSMTAAQRFFQFPNIESKVVVWSIKNTSVTQDLSHSVPKKVVARLSFIEESSLHPGMATHYFWFELPARERKGWEIFQTFSCYFIISRSVMVASSWRPARGWFWSTVVFSSVIFVNL